MRYEVIGWVDAEECDYPKHKYITAPVDAVIIKEIRKHGYLFGGDAHERYCPLLNDGTYVRYSWRGWGRIMALAHGYKETDYMMAYMDDMIDPLMRKYPEDLNIDESKIEFKENLADTFVMHLSEEMFLAMKEGIKTIEVRLFDEKRKLIDIGDFIEFHNKDNDANIKMRVADIRIEHTFKEVFERRIDLWNTSLYYTPEQLGFSKETSIDTLIKEMYKWYTKEQEEKYGVIAFTLEQL
ncbi:MAG: ASCH domain-containing protein [Anaeroplasmataceae bacterium]|nr:ASCH domain-containing protein [Anaeroplasmataceae bacterium]